MHTALQGLPCLFFFWLSIRRVGTATSKTTVNKSSTKTSKQTINDVITVQEQETKSQNTRTCDSKVDAHADYFCEVCGEKISKEEFESFEGMCENCYTEYLQQIEDDEGYYPK